MHLTSTNVILLHNIIYKVKPLELNNNINCLDKYLEICWYHGIDDMIWDEGRCDRWNQNECYLHFTVSCSSESHQPKRSGICAFALNIVSHCIICWLNPQSSRRGFPFPLLRCVCGRVCLRLQCAHSNHIYVRVIPLSFMVNARLFSQTPSAQAREYKTHTIS